MFIVVYCVWKRPGNASRRLFTVLFEQPARLRRNRARPQTSNSHEKIPKSASARSEKQRQNERSNHYFCAARALGETLSSKQ